MNLGHITVNIVHAYINRWLFIYSPVVLLLCQLRPLHRFLKKIHRNRDFKFLSISAVMLDVDKAVWNWRRRGFLEKSL